MSCSMCRRRTASGPVASTYGSESIRELAIIVSFVCLVTASARLGRDPGDGVDKDAANLAAACSHAAEQEAIETAVGQDLLQAELLRTQRAGGRSVDALVERLDDVDGDLDPGLARVGRGADSGMSRPDQDRV